MRGVAVHLNRPSWGKVSEGNASWNMVIDPQRIARIRSPKDVALWKAETGWTDLLNYEYSALIFDTGTDSALLGLARAFSAQRLDSGMTIVPVTRSRSSFVALEKFLQSLT